MQRCGSDRVLVLAGDHVYKMDYRKMLAFHEQVKADVTVGVVRVPIEQTHRFGTVTADAEGRILDFVEKAPDIHRVTWFPWVYTSLIMMFLPSAWLKMLPSRIRPMTLATPLSPRMVKKDKVYAFKFDGYWQDIGTIEAYYAANMELTREKPSFSLDGTWPVFTEAHDSSLPRDISPGQHTQQPSQPWLRD